jgi:hypothetical protein
METETAAKHQTPARLLEIPAKIWRHRQVSPEGCSGMKQTHPTAGIDSWR